MNSATVRVNKLFGMKVMCKGGVRVLLLCFLSLAAVECYFSAGTSRSTHSKLSMASGMKGGRNQLCEMPDGSTLSYDMMLTKDESSAPYRNPVVFLPGLIRQKNEAKATNLQVSRNL